MEKAHREKLIIESGQVFTIPEGEHYVAKGIIVEKGGKLVIEPGCKLKFGPCSGIICSGSMVAIGTKDAPILFTGGWAKWKNITFDRYTDECILRFCRIELGEGREMMGQGYKDIFVSPESLEKDKVTYYGGGVAILKGAKVLIEDSTIELCSAQIGGGIAILGASQVRINRCTVKENRAKGVRGMNYGGGGIYINGGYKENSNNTRPVITDCRIDENTSVEPYDQGGGIAIFQAKPILKNLIITGNRSCYGGGIYISNTNYDIVAKKKIHNCVTYDDLLPLITGSKITGNIATESDDSGGIYCSFDNCKTDEATEFKSSNNNLHQRLEIIARLRKFIADQNRIDGNRGDIDIRL